MFFVFVFFLAVPQFLQPKNNIMPYVLRPSYLHKNHFNIIVYIIIDCELCKFSDLSSHTVFFFKILCFFRLKSDLVFIKFWIFFHDYFFISISAEICIIKMVFASRKTVVLNFQIFDFIRTNHHYDFETNESFRKN